MPLSGLGLQTEGVVLCNQVRTLDWQAGRAMPIEAAPAEPVADVLARVAGRPTSAGACGPPKRVFAR